MYVDRVCMKLASLLFIAILLLRRLHLSRTRIYYYYFIIIPLSFAPTFFFFSFFLSTSNPFAVSFSLAQPLPALAPESLPPPAPPRWRPPPPPPPRHCPPAPPPRSWPWYSSRLCSKTCWLGSWHGASGRLRHLRLPMGRHRQRWARPSSWGAGSTCPAGRVVLGYMLDFILMKMGWGKASRGISIYDF